MSIPTRYGTREQLERACAMLRANGLDIYVDMVDNHRNGDDGSFNFRYVDAFGASNAGRFQKGQYDFHFNSANIPQDPNVPSPGDDYAYQFGRDVAHINGARRGRFPVLHRQRPDAERRLADQGARHPGLPL